MKKITYKLAGIVAFAWFFLIAASIAIPATSNVAMAQPVNSDAHAEQNALTRVMCNVLQIVTGTAGKTFAAFAIVSIGIGFFTGKVSWGLMIGVAAGIAAMFGAATIVAAITGQSAGDCSTITGSVTP